MHLKMGNYFKIIFSIIFSLFMIICTMNYADAKTDYQLGSEQELFMMLYQKNNIYKSDEKTKNNLLKNDSFVDYNMNSRNNVPLPVSILLMQDELYAPGEFYTVYQDSPLIRSLDSETELKNIIDVTEVGLYDLAGNPAVKMRQGLPHIGYLDLKIHNTQLPGELHSIFYKLPGQFDSIGSEAALIYGENQSIIGKIYPTLSGDRFLQIDFNDTLMSSDQDITVRLPIAVRARPKVKPGPNSVAFAKDDIRRIDITPFDPGIFSWVNVDDLVERQLARVSSNHWEDNHYLGFYSFVNVYPDKIRRDLNSKFQGFAEMAGPTYFFGSNSGWYYPDEVGICVDTFHTIMQDTDGNVFDTDLLNFIEEEGAEKLNLSMHMGAWLAQTAKTNPIGTRKDHEPYPMNQGRAIEYIDVPRNNRPNFMLDNPDSGQRWLISGQVAVWLLGMRYNKDANNRLEGITNAEATDYKTQYFYPVVDGFDNPKEINYRPNLEIIKKMRDNFKNTSYIGKGTSKQSYLLTDQQSIIVDVPKFMPNEKQIILEQSGLSDIPNSPREFFHYIDEEESFGLDCLDITQSFEDQYETTGLRYGNSPNNYQSFKRTGTYTHKYEKKFKEGQGLVPFTELKVAARCELQPGDTKLVIKKTTRDYWNDSEGYTAGIADQRQFMGVMTIPDNYRPRVEIDFYTGNGSINLVKYDKDNQPSATNEGTRLKDAEFWLYQVDGKDEKLVGKYKTSEDGIISVNNLPPGEYYFIEKTPPKGYELDDQSLGEKYKFTIKEDTFETVVSESDLGNGKLFIVNGNTPVIGIPNKKIPVREGEVAVEKIGESRKLLEGAVFMLYEETSESGEVSESFDREIINFNPIINKTTDSSGMAKFDHLKYDTIYMIQEIQPPPGYQLTEEKCIFKLTEDRIDFGGNLPCISDLKEWTVPNEPIPPDTDPEGVKGDILFYKYGAKKDPSSSMIISEKPLANVKFGVYTEEDVWLYDVYSDSSGKVQTNPLNPGNYYFKEESTSDGYILIDERIEFTINNDGTGAFTSSIVSGNKLYNYRELPKKGLLIVTKYDADGLGKTLSGATFKLCKNENGTDCVGEEQTTNDKGQVKFDDLDKGTYYLIETKAPEGYDLNENPVLEINVTLDDPASGIIYKSITNEKTPSRDFIFQKVDSNTHQGLSGAEFVLQKQKSSDVWEDTNYKYRTDTQGVIELDEDKIDKIGEGTYRLKETKAPEGYHLPENPYSQEFVITKRNITPSKVVMENKRLDHELIVQKKVDKQAENITNVNPANITFVIQAARKDKKHWERFSNDNSEVSFTTDMNGSFIVNNDTAPGVIDAMLYDYNQGTYSEFRFREAMIPYGSELQDPLYPMSGIEDYNQGEAFSIPIPIEKIANANSEHKNYVGTFELENKLEGYELIFTKRDSVNNALLNGAKFKLTTYKNYDPKKTEEQNNSPENIIGEPKILTLGSDNKYHAKDLLMGYDYILKEIEAPENYGARSDKYWFNLNYQVVTIDDDDLGIPVKQKQEVMEVKLIHENDFENVELLKENEDYIWKNDPGNKQLIFDDQHALKNTALPKIPITGGKGFTIFSIIGIIFSALGYSLYLYIDKRIKNIE